MEILYTSADLHKKVQWLLAGPKPSDRRVVVVAYIGPHAEAYLPDPNDLDIVCCMKPGSTSALALTRLRRRGAKIFKSDHLHMKVYWSERKGCVVCSANVSSAALGKNSQKEMGVFLNPGSVKIERVLRYVKRTEIKHKDLLLLQRQNDSIPRDRVDIGGHDTIDYLQWQAERLNNWKVSWWSEDVSFARESKAISKQRYGNEPHGLLNVAKGQLKANEWVLLFRSPSVTSVEWLHVDFIVKTDRSYADFHSDWAYQAVQARSPSKSPREPFKLDQRFRSALKRAVRQYGLEALEDYDCREPPKRLLALIAKYLKEPNR